jgi:hypothetical protein
MTKKRIAILLLIFVNVFCVAFSYYVMKASDENHGKYTFYFKVRFDARINSENLYGELKNSDGTRGKEVQIPVQTEVHVIGVKKSGDIKVESPIMIELEGENQKVYLDYVSLDYISMDDIDRSVYAKELLQSKIQENQQNIDSKIRNHLLISILAGVILFAAFLCVFLFIEKKCSTARRYKILFGCLFIATILSLLLTGVFNDYMGHCK